MAGKRLSEEKEALRLAAWEMGYSDVQASRILGISIGTFNQWRVKKMGLPANFPSFRNRRLDDEEDLRRFEIYETCQSDERGAKLAGVTLSTWVSWRRTRLLPRPDPDPYAVKEEPMGPKIHISALPKHLKANISPRSTGQGGTVKGASPRLAPVGRGSRPPVKTTSVSASIKGDQSKMSGRTIYFNEQEERTMRRILENVDIYKIVENSTPSEALELGMTLPQVKRKFSDSRQTTKETEEKSREDAKQRSSTKKSGGKRGPKKGSSAYLGKNEAVVPALITIRNELAKEGQVRRSTIARITSREHNLSYRSAANAYDNARRALEKRGIVSTVIPGTIEKGRRWDAIDRFLRIRYDVVTEDASDIVVDVNPSAEA